jgi:chromosome condensin MukBEF ATPase and DNA-binding subunit MukB
MLQQRDAIAGEKAAAMTTLADLQQQLSVQTEALRLAQAAEADQLARAGVLEGESRLAREEVERVQLQVDHLQDELENFFLQGKARAQLVEAQHEQLLRAQFLISRLLGRPFPPELRAEAVAVEVLPTQTSGSPIPSLPGGEPGTRGWAGRGLLRKLLRGG